MTDRIKIGDKIYEAKTISDLSILHLLELEAQLEQFGRPMRVAQLRALGREMAELPEGERAEHPEALLMMGVGVWAARRAAGEKLTFAEAIDFPMSTFTTLPSPKDHAPPANPTKPRAGSARAKKTPGAPRKTRSS